MDLYDDSIDDAVSSSENDYISPLSNRYDCDLACVIENSSNFREHMQSTTEKYSHVDTN